MRWDIEEQGTWSDVYRVREERVLFGNFPSQVKLKKAWSSFSRVGLRRLLVLMKFRSRRGSSMSWREFIVSLKRWASEAWKFLLLFWRQNILGLNRQQSTRGCPRRGQYPRVLGEK